MTAKEKLRARVEELTEQEAEATLDFIASCECDDFARWLDSRPEDPSDPSSFLAESIHEMFDEYYSVSLSFWTRAGLAEKARQGHRVGSLPWGYVRDKQTGGVVPDPERAPLVLAIFERYATGQESDRTTAEWLNAKGATTARGRRFGADTVREMLLNASYCGYVTGLRDQSREIRGRHEPIVPEELFDRVQEIRRWRTRVVKGGRAAEDYLLRQLLYCERCGARMQGTRGSRAQHRRYQCGTRRRGGDCTQRIGTAEPLEQYVIRRQALEQEVERIGPPIDPDIARAEALLDEFARFWKIEDNPGERQKLLAQLFDRVWQDGGQIVAVKPRAPFARYFQAADAAGCNDRERRASNPHLTPRIEIRL